MPGETEELSRRNFIKLSSLALAGFLSAPRVPMPRPQSIRFEKDLGDALESAFHSGNLSATNFPELLPHLQGRIIESAIGVHREPDFRSVVEKFLWQDSVVPILSVIYREDTESHNKVWYQVSDGFIHSGSVQPVNTILNEPETDFPPEGRLAEVTVPYTDAHWAVGKDQPVAYRLYYQTTHWVVEHQLDEQGESWYTLIEDKWDLRYYVQARHLRVIPEVELTQLSPEVPNALKRLVVYLAQQILIAYEDQKPVFVTRVASGGKFRDGNFSTQPGHYQTFHKRPSRHMAAGNLAAGGYDLPGVPWISYFTESGISFHGTYWHNNYGRPRSHGCINLSPLAAKWVYRWTLPVVPSNAHMVYKNYGTAIHIVEA